MPLRAQGQGGRVARERMPTGAAVTAVGGEVRARVLADVRPSGDRRRRTAVVAEHTLRAIGYALPGLRHLDRLAGVGPDGAVDRGGSAFGAVGDAAARGGARQERLVLARRVAIRVRHVVRGRCGVWGVADGVRPRAEILGRVRRCIRPVGAVAASQRCERGDTRCKNERRVHESVRCCARSDHSTPATGDAKIPNAGVATHRKIVSSRRDPTLTSIASQPAASSIMAT